MGVVLVRSCSAAALLSYESYRVTFSSIHVSVQLFLLLFFVYGLVCIILMLHYSQEEVRAD